jgi:hypothetical protein
VRDVLLLGDDFLGDVTLVGPRRSEDRNLAVGDALAITARDGQPRRVMCVQFPLVNLGRDRRDWVRVSVTGVKLQDVQVGSWATRID